MLTDSIIRPSNQSGYLAEYLLLQVWAPPYRFMNDKKTAEIDHTKQSNGWFLSCTFAIPFHFILWQKCNLKTTVYRGVMHKEQRGMDYEFSSSLHKKFLWVAVCGVLLWDAINYPFLFMGEYKIPTIMLVIASLGIALKVSILVSLIRRKGSIKLLVGVWGALMIAGGLFGFVAIFAALEQQPISVILGKSLLLSFGLALVMPLSKSIRTFTDA